MNRTIRHHDYLVKLLRDPVEAAAYLNAVSEDGDTAALLKALRNVVEAQGGIGELAGRTKMSRTTLYRTLSDGGNPELATLNAILAVYRIRIGFFPRKARRPRRLGTMKGQFTLPANFDDPLPNDVIKSFEGKH